MKWVILLGMIIFWYIAGILFYCWYFFIPDFKPTSVTSKFSLAFRTKGAYLGNLSNTKTKIFLSKISS